MSERRRLGAGLAGLAAAVYLPLLLTNRGRVGADTKSYLYIAPERLLERATSMWDPNVGLGTVTHQTIGYLFPMGPYYWLLDTLAVPDWVAQRLWLGTVLFAAGAGVVFLAGVIGLRRAAPATLAAALAYMLTPYILSYAARASAILLPFAGLPWMVGLAARALRRGGWRDPAQFALVVLLVGGVNATSLVLAGLGPVLWIVFAVAGREVGVRAALATVATIGLLTSLTSLWWLAGLAIQGAYGIEILEFTETVETVARASTANEVLRHLGYWFFYGSDKLELFITAAHPYMKNPVLIGATYLLASIGLGAVALVRSRHRAYLAVLVVAGTIIAVGANPYDGPAPLGRLFKAFARSATVGLALRSSSRVLPLVVLAAAVALAIVLARLRRTALASAGVAVLAVACLPALWTGALSAPDNLARDEHLPAYWHEAGRWLDEADPQGETRVFELPGSDFAFYRWGMTIDPVAPYLMDRPYVGRELVPYGSHPSADLLNAVDRRLQEGVFEPAAIGPVARLMSAGHVTLRADLQYERYRTPRPRLVAAELTGDAARRGGLGRPVGFGQPTPNVAGPQLPLIDEIELALPAGSAHPAPVTAFPVSGPRPIVRAEAAAGAMVVAGDGEALVALAAAGLLDGERAVHYAASGNPAAAAHLVLTDHNRLRARRWGIIRENLGYTESIVDGRAGGTPLVEDPADARLELFDPGTPLDRFTVVEQRGVREVRASHYGNPISYTPEDRPANALDGDVTTAWRVGAFADVEGERWRVDLVEPVSAGEVTLVQPVTGPRNRHITRARLTFDDDDGGGEPLDVQLDETSRTPAGQVVSFPSRSFRRLELEVLDTNVGKRPRYDGVSGVGLAEVRVAGVRVDEIVRLPRGLRPRAGQRMSVVMERSRSNPAEPVRADEELAMARLFDLPGPRTFTLAGTARVSAEIADDAVDRLLGRPGPVVARSSSRLPGDLGSRAASAVDGDQATAWTPGFGEQAGHWVEIEVGQPVTFDRLDLAVRDDARHSVPTRLRLEVDGAAGPVVDVADPRFPPVTGRRFRFVVDAVQPRQTIDFYSEAPITLPVSITELGIPGVVVAPVPATVDTGCRSDLLTVAGRPAPVRILGETAAARAGLRVEGCEPVVAAAGEVELRTAQGRGTGFDLDRLVLDSGAAPRAPGAPRVEVVERGSTSYRLRVGHGTEPYWVVLGQSYNRGWSASIGGRDLGPPRLIDGFANGWLVDPGTAGTATVDLRWRPQRAVRWALLASLVAAAACLAIAVFAPRRPDREPAPARPGRGRSRRRWVAPVAATAVAGLAGGLVPAVAVAAITVLGRGLVPLVPAAALALAGAYVTVQEVRYGYPADFAWPVPFGRAAVLAWVAVGCLVHVAFSATAQGSRPYDDPATGLESDPL